jgi:FkbM family methyltransferase
MNALKSLLYGTLEVLTAGGGIPRDVGGERIRFPPRWCRYYQRGYEPNTFRFLRAHCRPGQTVLDVGAHLGLFSVVMARLVAPGGRVISFEPTSFTRRILERTVRLNGLAGVVEVRGEAVTGRTGVADFFDTGSPASNANSLVPADRVVGAKPVPTVSLDDFVGTHQIRLGCVKIDVEGAELDLLRGACKTITGQRPAVYLAVHPAAVCKAGGSLGDLWTLLASYKMNVYRDGVAVSEAEFNAATDLFDVELLPNV